MCSGFNSSVVPGLAWAEIETEARVRPLAWRCAIALRDRPIGKAALRGASTQVRALATERNTNI